MQKRNLVITLSGILILLVVCLVSYNHFSEKDYSGRLTKDYVVENGFLIDQTEGISSYQEIFKLLAANNIDIMNIKKDKPVQMSDEDKDKVIELFIKGAKSQELGIDEPEWLEIVISGFEPELKKTLKIYHLINPFLNETNTQKELAIAFIAFGDQLCKYKDKIINLMGIACKQKSIAFLIDNDPGDNEQLTKKYLEFKTEIENDFERVKTR